MSSTNKILTTDSEGVIVAVYDTNLLGSSGGNNSSGSYRHDQSSSSAVWVIPHALNKYPSLTVVDSENELVIGEVEYLSLMELKVTFSKPISGTAFCN